MSNDHWAIFARAHYPTIEAFKKYTEYWKNKWCVIFGIDGPISYVDLLGTLHDRIERATYDLETVAELVTTMPVSEETIATLEQAAKATSQAEKLLAADLETWAKRRKSEGVKAWK